MDIFKSPQKVLVITHHHCVIDIWSLNRIDK